jgi:hypothetical protein
MSPTSDHRPRKQNPDRDSPLAKKWRQLSSDLEGLERLQTMQLALIRELKRQLASLREL